MLFTVDFAMQIIWLWWTSKDLEALSFYQIVTKHTEFFVKLNTLQDVTCLILLIKHEFQNLRKVIFLPKYRMILRRALRIFGIWVMRDITVNTV